MRCRVCGSEALIEAEYKTGSIRAPALECAKCHALNLDERGAKSEGERDSVRRAMAARQTAGSPLESGTHRASTIGLAAAVDAAVSEVEVALAELRIAHEFLGQMVEGELGRAVSDAQAGARRIENLMMDLGRRCARETRRVETEAVEVEGTTTASGRRAT